MKSKKLMTILIAGAALMGATFGGCGLFGVQKMERAKYVSNP